MLGKYAYYYFLNQVLDEKIATNLRHVWAGTMMHLI